MLLRSCVKQSQVLAIRTLPQIQGRNRNGPITSIPAEWGWPLIMAGWYDLPANTFNNITATSNACKCQQANWVAWFGIVSLHTV
jgi:hypothetical protein